MSARSWSYSSPQFSYDLFFPNILEHKKFHGHQSGEHKARVLGHPPCPPRKNRKVCFAHFPRNPRRSRQGLRWALEHQAMTKKHVVSCHPIADTTKENIGPMSAVARWTYSVKSQTSNAGRLDRSGRSAMEHHGGHAIDSGQSL